MQGKHLCSLRLQAKLPLPSLLAVAAFCFQGGFISALPNYSACPNTSNHFHIQDSELFCSHCGWDFETSQSHFYNSTVNKRTFLGSLRNLRYLRYQDPIQPTPEFPGPTTGPDRSDPILRSQASPTKSVLRPGVLQVYHREHAGFQAKGLGFFGGPGGVAPARGIGDCCAFERRTGGSAVAEIYSYIVARDVAGSLGSGGKGAGQRRGTVAVEQKWRNE